MQSMRSQCVTQSRREQNFDSFTFPDGFALDRVRSRQVAVREVHGGVVGVDAGLGQVGFVVGEQRFVLVWVVSIEKQREENID